MHGASAYVWMYCKTPIIYREYNFLKDVKEESWCTEFVVFMCNFFCSDTLGCFFMVGYAEQWLLTTEIEHISTNYLLYSGLLFRGYVVLQLQGRVVGWFHDNDCLVCLLVKDEPVDKYASHELTLRNNDFKRQTCYHHFLNYDALFELKMHS